MSKIRLGNFCFVSLLETLRSKCQIWRTVFFRTKEGRDIAFILKIPHSLTVRRYDIKCIRKRIPRTDRRARQLIQVLQRDQSTFESRNKKSLSNCLRKIRTKESARIYRNKESVTRSTVPTPEVLLIIWLFHSFENVGQVTGQAKRNFVVSIYIYIDIEIDWIKHILTATTKMRVFHFHVSKARRRNLLWLNFHGVYETRA